MLAEFPFVGRSKEINNLLGLWEDVCRPGNGPRMVTVLGEPGYGKTRLIREFYSRIAAGHRHKSNFYWPESLPDDGSRMDLNPKFSADDTRDEIPWLWWGIRCEPVETRNAVQDEGCAFIRSNEHLMQHTGALEKKRHEAEKMDRLKAASLTQLLKLAEEIPVVGTVIRHYSSSKDWLELYRSAVQVAKKSSAPAPGKKHRLDVQAACEACVEICQTFIDPTSDALPTVPLVLVVDDAHAADPLTVQCIYKLLHFAYTKNLPLLLIATHWTKEWKSSDIRIPPNLTAAESWASFRQIACALPLRPDTPAESVFHELECDAIDCAPIIEELNLELGEKAEQNCLKFADGNPQMLRELVSFLHECRGHPGKDWWFKQAAPAMELSENGFAEFVRHTSSKEEFLRRRAESVQRDPHLSVLLQLGALQGHSFLGKFTAEIWSSLENPAETRPDHLELLRAGETPHHVIRLSSEEDHLARFRHRSYRDAFLSIDPAKRRLFLDKITAMTASWLEATPEDVSNAGFFRFAVDWFRENDSPQHLEKALAVRAEHLIQLGRPSVAVELLEERLGLLVATDGPRSPEANIAKLALGEALAEAGRFDQSIAMLEPLREVFSAQDELWVDASRTLARTLQKTSEANGAPKNSFVNWVSGKRAATPERNRAAEILYEVWNRLRQRLGADSLDALLAGVEYGNAFTEGATDNGLKADQGIIILPCCAVLLSKFKDNEAAKDIALLALGNYLAAWRWPKRMSISPDTKFPEVGAYWDQNCALVDGLKLRYPEAADVFRELYELRSGSIGPQHPETMEAKRLELESTGLKSMPDDRTGRFRALATKCESLLGEHHPQTLECKAALAAHLLGSDDTRFEAAHLLRQIVETARQHLGDAHPRTSFFRNTLRNINPHL